jgi:threonine/homoserine/homoserine lactone efflux protein
VLTAFGVVAGQATWAFATAAGVAALLHASQPAFQAVKLVGSAYLVYLGLQALVAALRTRAASETLRSIHDGRRAREARVSPSSVHSANATQSVAKSAFARRPAGRGAPLRQGLISNLTNPKMGAFFPSLLPQFAGSHASFGTLLALGLIFCSMTLVWLIGYAAAVAKAGDFLRRARIKRTLEAVTGVALIALGLRLATEKR